MQAAFWARETITFFIFSDILFSFILFDPDSGKTHVLNATAVKIYRLCTNTEPEGIALSILEEGMDVDKEVILEDVCDTIQNFVELKIIAAI